MVIIKNSEQLMLMRKAGRITYEALLVARDTIRPGISTKEVDSKIRRFIEKCGAVPSFLGYGGFPGSACISINNEVIHGIPSPKVIIRDGDIVKVDVGKVSDEALRLISVTEQSFYEAMKVARHGNRVGDIGAAVENFVISNGFTVVKDYTGHGVGADLHEDPEVPNYGRAGRGTRLYSGMTLAVEPMVNQGGEAVRVLKDGWCVVTADGSLSAHFENSIAITESDPILLTDVDN